MLTRSGIIAGASGGGAPSFSELTLTKAPTAYFGVRKLSTYSGNCCQINGTTDVAFVNNQLQATSGEVSRLYEQAGLSGGGLFASQSVAGDYPSIDATYGKIGTVQGLMFDGANSGTTREREIVLPLELALPSKDHSAVFVGINAVGNALSSWGSAKDSDAVSNDVIIWTVGAGLAIRGTAITNQTMPTYVPSVAGVFGFTSDATNTRLYQLNRTQNRTAASTAETIAGGRIGNCSTANNRGTFVLLAALFYTPALTGAEMTTLRAELEAAFGLTTTYNTTFGVIGDSNFEGTGSSLCRNAPSQIRNTLRAPARFINAAAFGTTLATWDTISPGILTGQFSGWTATYKFMLCNLGVNDLIGSVSAAAMSVSLQSLITEAVANSWGFGGLHHPASGQRDGGKGNRAAGLQSGRSDELGKLRRGCDGRSCK